MGRREELHRLVRDLKNYAAFSAESGMRPGALPAPESEREAYEAWQASRQSRKLEAMRRSLTESPPRSQTKGPVEPARMAAETVTKGPVEPARIATETVTKGPVEPVPSAVTKGPVKPAQVVADTVTKGPVQGAQLSAEIETKGPDPSLPVGQGGALWKEFGSRPRPTFGEPEAPEDENAAAHKLASIREVLGDCSRCGLCDGRTHIVFGAGSADTDLVFVGEAPGADEDRVGKPFVGEAGKLLDKMIVAMGRSRDDVYVSNVLKCRPPENRDPTRDEVQTCSPFLVQQLEAIRPRVIVAMGRVATNVLLDRDGTLGEVRGRWHEFNGIPVMPTYHPAFLLRSPDAKRPAWDDLQAVMKKLEE